MNSDYRLITESKSQFAVFAKLIKSNLKGLGYGRKKA